MRRMIAVVALAVAALIGGVVVSAPAQAGCVFHDLKC